MKPPSEDLRMAGAFLGTSAHAHGVRGQITFHAPRRSTVLIIGPSGSGKSLVGGLLHRHSGRAGDYVRIPLTQHQGSELLQSVFAGHVAGAFTGGVRDRAGLVRQAQGGTLFLDEFQDADARGQAHLLDILERQPLRPVGADREFQPDVRIVVGSQLSRAELLRRGVRADLLYRLGLVTIELLPLREHLEDLAVLVPALLEHIVAEEGIGPCGLSAPAARALCRYNWPGNVRELESVLHCAVLRRLEAGGDPSVLGPDDLALPASPRRARRRLVHPAEREITAALVQAGGRISVAARTLGIPRESLSRRLKASGLWEMVEELRREAAVSGA